MAGLLPGKTREIIYRTCALHIYESMEDSVSIYRQQYEEEGMIRNYYVFQVVPSCILYISSMHD